MRFAPVNTYPGRNIGSSFKRRSVASEREAASLGVLMHTAEEIRHIAGQSTRVSANR